ncbi:hypothetical protein QO002_001923 [Pararhizobium capsulatum DSM 1112]|uniref:Rap1a immunity protein domain-containing protein n=1 Tax=Pararhizobium capsulatum DSM 1112 TaxID=1121113 RepID=A0ABU0BNF2_9HYPH|nr:Rap1a/Tai family immunity protein [Pararhizobium capsulatum]MDQ0319785.1 hypothetical protein [Pararhizobium capsulatum DSM 1112]
MPGRCRLPMIVLAALAAVAPTTARAQFVDGVTLHAFCQPPRNPALAGYVAGVLDRWSRDLHHAELADVVDAENNRPKSTISVTAKIRANICAPDTIILQEHIDVVCAFLEANPLELGRSADILVQTATALRWPCS